MRSDRIVVLLVLAAVATAPTVSADAQTTSGKPAPYDIAAHYKKYEYRIPMRDGVSLFTSVFVPRDTTRSYPILMVRTPYGVGPYGENAYPPYPRALGPGDEFLRAGYIFVRQDVRGRFRSGGTFVQMTPHLDVKHGQHDIDESTDTYDTIDWLIHHVSHNNGRVGLWGISYSGFFAAAGAIEAHPALKAVSPQAPQADWFLGDDVHHNGAFFLTSAFNWMAMCGRSGPTSSMACGDPFDFGTPDGYSFYLGLGALKNADARYFHGQIPGWTEIMEHGTYDSLWQARNLRPHFRNVTPAILSVGGWYDANNLYGALQVYQSITRQSPSTDARIVVGPWTHGQWVAAGDSINSLHFGSNTSEFYRASIIFPFFEHYLRSDTPPDLPRVYAFETGANAWRKYPSWPPPRAQAKSLYFHANGLLSFDPPTDTGARAFDEYVSDPSHPVPYVPSLSTDMDPDYMSQDQRFTATRPDVLVYESAPLDADVTIAGPISPNLFVSTTGTDGDWIVKVIDVHPEDPPGVNWASPQAAAPLDAKRIRALYYAEQAHPLRGFQELVRGDVIRGKFRNSFEHPEPFTPGAVTHVKFDMDDVLHTFKRGHRILIEVQSTWFPLVDRNPQRFEDIYHADDADFRSATERVYRSPMTASSVSVLVVSGQPPQVPTQ
jgi:putative CocE/NonD family hydrolase